MRGWWYLGAIAVVVACQEGGDTASSGAGGGSAGGGTPSSGAGGVAGSSGAGGAVASSGAGGETCLPSKCPDPGECVAPICVTDYECGTANEAAGTACTSGGQVCDGSGKCVECVSASDCTDASKPLCEAGVCLSATCADGKENGDETDVDCGGSCAACPNYKACKQATDCASGYCEAGIVCLACSKSAECSADKWCDTLVDGGTCVVDLAQAAACTEAAQCPGDLCVDGFCCDVACGDTCRACSKAKTGQADGTCADVIAVTDPDKECAGAWCNGSGECVCTVEVALGYYHSCARRQDGTLWCWGNNGDGQLGDGTTANKSSPVEVTALGTAVVEVALGGYHSCARRQDGTLWCWGNNFDGQLGNEKTSKGPYPVFALGTTVVDVALGRDHTCARKQDGTLWCWGDNSYGKLGDGTTVQKSSPVEVTALGTAVAEVALGAYHSCARKQDGTLWCWGNNAYGQLGDGTTASKSTPVEVTAFGTTVVDVALGDFHSCARKQDGTLWCWGYNVYGQLGNGATVNKSSPVELTALGTTVVDVALGRDHTCARKQDGTLRCWGNNYSGQLGDGTTADKSSPVEVTALGTTVIDVALGGYHSCALKPGATLWCWGSNNSGQLGDGTTVGKSSPVQVALCP